MGYEPTLLKDWCHDVASFRDERRKKGYHPLEVLDFLCILERFHVCNSFHFVRIRCYAFFRYSSGADVIPNGSFRNLNFPSLVSSHNAFVWGPSQQIDFERIKNLLTSSPCLTTHVSCDWSTDKALAPYYSKKKPESRNLCLQASPLRVRISQELPTLKFRSNMQATYPIY